MPVSRNRKKHKQKVQQFRNNKATQEKNLKQKMLIEYFEKQAMNTNQNTQSTGSVIENNDIEIDVDVDLNE